MKKGLGLFSLSLVLLMSASSTLFAASVAGSVSDNEVSASRVVTTPIYSSVVAPTPRVAHVTRDEVSEDSENIEICNNCGDEEPNNVVCAKEVKVIRYSDKCDGGNGQCGFPVSVRKTSLCDNMEEM